jgi:hypothetical protein
LASESDGIIFGAYEQFHVPQWSKITEEISDAKLESLPHSAYSPDLSPCNFWLFGILKEKMRDRAFQTVKDILDAVTLIWNAMSFEQVQSVFLNWMERLE